MIEIDRNRVPEHIAIVMDGNGCCATRQGLQRIEGHVRGYVTLRNILEAAADLGIKVLTAYAFSTENWRRPKEEVDALMHLFAKAARRERDNLMQNDIRMMVSGRLHELPPEAQESLLADIEATKDNKKIILNLAVNYGGRSEITDAARKIAKKVLAGEISPDEIDEKLFSKHLYAPELPDPDLLIRTAGEMRVSNFLLWEIAYAEIHVTQVLWPDFTKDDLIKAVLDYQGRTRKFGAVVDDTKR